MKARAPFRTPPRRELGAFGILYAIMLPVMLGMIGLAVDLSIMYARGHELQAVADGAALAAARALDGTQDGLDAARANARSAARKAEFNFLNSETFEWSSAALSFSASPDGPWIPSDSVSTLDIPGLLYAQVDTAGLDAMYGSVAIAFLRVVGVEGEQTMARRAVAGRRDTAITPLAVCALNNTPLTSRSNAPSTGVDEAVEYGFRRGVGYNLLQLNPNGSSAKSYVVNPLDFPPAPQVASHYTDDAVRPFVCSGAIPAPEIAGGSQVYVREPFPSSMVAELNSRFGNYGGGSVCTHFGAPPDANVIDFRGGYSGFWISGAPQPLQGSATSFVDGARLATVADASVLPAGTTAASYGTLWSFSRPLRFNSATGTSGAAFTRNDWNKLYPVSSGSPLSSSYSNAVSPYDRNVAPHRLTPAIAGTFTRRILNVPLLECPVAGSTARVLAIGRFLMTTPATLAPAAIHAEFGGITTYGPLTASAVLYQ